MKRLTALALTGVLLLATACGGNQTNGTATNGDAGAGAAQQQTSDGAADPTAEATDQIPQRALQGRTEPLPGAVIRAPRKAK